MLRRGYVIAFVLVLLAVLAGAFLAGRFLVRGLRQEPGSNRRWTPPELTVTPLPGQPGLTPTPAAIGARPTATRSPAPPRQVGPATPVVTAPTPTSAPQATFTPPAPSATPGETPTVAATVTATATATATTVSAFDYALTRPVRHSTGDCPGNYVMGLVTDRSGSPLPGVRLSLVDGWGNSASAVTKSAAGEVGRYDFPLFSPQRYYLTVVDAAGRPISSRIEIPHGVGPNVAATCHWVDWQRR